MEPAWCQYLIKFTCLPFNLVRQNASRAERQSIRRPTHANVQVQIGIVFHSSDKRRTVRCPRAQFRHKILILHDSSFVQSPAATINQVPDPSLVIVRMVACVITPAVNTHKSWLLVHCLEVWKSQVCCIVRRHVETVRFGSETRRPAREWKVMH